MTANPAAAPRHTPCQPRRRHPGPAEPDPERRALLAELRTLGAMLDRRRGGPPGDGLNRLLAPWTEQADAGVLAALLHDGLLTLADLTWPSAVPAYDRAPCYLDRLDLFTRSDPQ